MNVRQKIMHVSSESGLLYLTDIRAEKLVEIDSNNKILRHLIHCNQAKAIFQIKLLNLW